MSKFIIEILEGRLSQQRHNLSEYRRRAANALDHAESVGVATGYFYNLHRLQGEITALKFAIELVKNNSSVEDELDVSE